MDSDGSNAVPLTVPGPGGDSSREPQYSPDGSRIVFVRQTGGTGRFEIWIMNADGSGQTPLTTVSGNIQDGRPSFSPDGQRIAWSRFTGPPPNQDIYIMNADGSNQTQVTSGPGQDYAPEFSPDGTRIVFERESQNFQYSDTLLADPNGLDLGITPLTAEPGARLRQQSRLAAPQPAELHDRRRPDPEVDSSRSSSQSRCQNENAAVVAEGSGKAPKPKSGATASKAKRFTIPPVSGTGARGQRRRTLTLTIPKKGKKALKKAAKAGKKGKATISATFTDDLGQSSTASLTVKFKPKKK